MSNFVELHPVGDELFHADWLTDVKLKVAFRSFANAPLISCLARILDKSVACNYIASLNLICV
jgi:hypothetical protein